MKSHLPRVQRIWVKGGSVASYTLQLNMRQTFNHGLVWIGGFFFPIIHYFNTLSQNSRKLK